MQKRILVVDDHAGMRRDFRAMLAERYDICGEAANGREAVARADELRPDLIILDVNMPVMSGIEAAQRIRQLLPEAKILIVSADDAASVEAYGRLAGADAAVPKTRPRELTRAIEGLLVAGS